MPHKSKYIAKPLQLGNKSIGERISTIRKKKGLTQQELAAKIGITRSLVSSYEVGRIRLYDDMVARFAIALEASSDEILGLKKITDTKDEKAK